MEFNSFIFPAPKVDKEAKEKAFLQDNIIYLPKKQQQQKYCLTSFTSQKIKKTNHIPCKWIEYQYKGKFSNKIMIAFHGNAEDLLSTGVLMQMIMVEYPGYGIYKGKCSSQNIEQDAKEVYEYLISNNIDPQDIILFGRSIGSGPAFYLASQYKVGCLISMSAYTNIKDAAAFLVGSILSKLVKQRFQNDERIKNVKSPIFIIHGIKDNIIPYQHSQLLVQNCKSKNLGFIFPKQMTHNQFEIHADILDPIINFFNKIELEMCMMNQNNFEFLKNAGKLSQQINFNTQEMQNIKASNN